MNDEKELALYRSEIERYIETLPGKKPGESAGQSSKKKTRNALADFMLILSKHGRTWPEQSDYDEYRAGKPDNETTKQNVKRIERFFAWLEPRKETIELAEEYAQQGLFPEKEAGVNEPETLGANEPEISQAVDDSASTENMQASEAEPITENEFETWPGAENEPAPVKNKGGRKRYDTEKGEKRSVKFMVYFTPSVMAELKDLCSMKHTTCANYLFELACREIEKNGEALAFFREGMSKLI